jgi:hypothetical protein
VSFFQTRVDFADRFADPLAGVRLFGFQLNARGRLRQHGLCQMAVNHFELDLAWKPTMIGLLEWNVDAFPFNFRCIAAPDAQFVDSQRDPRSSEEL